MKRFRQNMVTYPFHYQQTEAEDFFEKPSGSVYLHIPFCNQKCRFCNFKAYKLVEEEYIGTYLEVLKKHIGLAGKFRHWPEMKIEAVYFGGGNPGLLQAHQTLELLKAVRDHFDVQPSAEISMEFDPIMVSEEKLSDLRAGGFNRISMGVQSLDDEILEKVGRIHTAQEAMDAHELMRKAGFENVNLDLVYPFPDLSLEKWEQTIEGILDLDPNAISTYGLELWPGTPFFQDAKNGNFEVCSPETEAEMYKTANQKIMAKDYDQITVYGYTHKRLQAQYHCKFMEAFYWNNLPMIGLGVGAMNYLNGDFWVNLRNVSHYMEKVNAGVIPIEFGRHLTHDEQMRRFVIRGLKKTKVSRSDFFRRHGQSLDAYFRSEIDSCLKQGLATLEGDWLKLTPLGCNYNTNVYREFFRPEDLIPVKTPGAVDFGLSKDIDAAMAGEYQKGDG